MNDLTVIVTIRNRRNTLPRVMHYYKDFPANVIFLDSTQEGIYEHRHLAAPNKYEYVPGKNYVQKVNDCLKGIKTKYSAVVCDDDFLSRTGIESCLSFLDNNKEYAACRGQEVCLYDKYMDYETLDYLIYTLDDFKSNSARDRVSRAWNYFNGANVHNIIRTEVQIKIQEFHLQNPQFNALDIYDKTFSYMTAVYGNIAVLPVFYIVRSSEQRATSLRLDSSFVGDISDWKPEVSFKDHFLDLDTTPLEDLVEEDRKFIEVLFENLCTSELKEKRFLELLKDNELLPLKVGERRGCLRIFDKVGGLSDVLIPYTDRDIIGWYGGAMGERAFGNPAPAPFPPPAYFPRQCWPLLARLSAGGNLMLNNGYIEKFKEGGEAHKLYPVLEYRSVENLIQIMKYVTLFPL